MSASMNTRVILTSYAPKEVHSTSIFTIDRSQPPPDISSLSEGQVLVKLDAISIDPHLRLFIDAPPSEASSDSVTDDLPKPFLFTLNQPIMSIGVGKVVASVSAEYNVGDRVRAEYFPWQTYAVFSSKDLTKIPDSGRPLEDYVGILGMTSFTAYLGLIDVGRPKSGETLLVSAASGAVGQIVVQLGKARGLRVIGVVGSDDKATYIKNIGADAVLNYKTCGNYECAIRKIAPEGIDIYFDNVGGALLDAALLNLNVCARVVLCGSMATYASDTSKVTGIKNLDKIIVKEVTMKSIFYLPHIGTKIESDFFDEMHQLEQQGKILFKLDARDGLEHAPQALVDLFTGANLGKVIVREV
ncbi:hypothetical protein GGI25_001332 [Coemansia spiralis]|uniref:Enoyl reductase (ER) domain-containing protein n=2 Tax=Coemansia TaxID=4863 RepID=A0A9W8G699_9FUNG|nr:hypothetical protein EDC05_001197 [Coemansia umbellata]KAJ2624034.1 hypothetical protein GGI26_001827 [Coemansia sp. RSA 1358]KAJ2679642.1 hypothetical protein GGI25_001332 [Coemansia spiralis]